MNRQTWKHTLWYCLLLLASLPVKGQINPVSSFYWENPYIINPAFVQTDARAVFTLSGRKQWIGLDGSPVTTFGSGTFYSEKHRMQAGVKLLNDRVGYVNSTDLSLSYAYTLPFRSSFLSMGFSWGYQFRKTDRGELRIEDDTDPVLAGIGGGEKQWNGELGLEYILTPEIRFGVSSRNFLSFFRKEGSVFGGTNYVYGRYRTRILGRGYRPSYRTSASPTTYDMEWGVCVRQTEGEIQVDGVLSFYLNHPTQREKFQFSVLGRSTGEVGILAGVKLLSEMKILFSYDYNLRALKGNTRGSFEAIVTYPLFPVRCVADGVKK